MVQAAAQAAPPIAPTPDLATNPLDAMSDVEDEEATVVKDYRTVPLSQPPDDEDATVIRDVHPLPVVQQSAVVLSRTQPSQPIPPALAELEMLARKNPDAQTAADQEKPPASPPVAPLPNVATVTVARQASPEVEPADLFDEDEEQAGPAKAVGYASAHDPPSTPESLRPRPAAGTPAPPSVVVSQPQVPIDALGHLIQPRPELTHPALRSLRAPGTVQISIGSLIVGALALVVLVLLAVLLLR